MTDYHLTIEDQDGHCLIAHRDNLYEATGVYLDALIEHHDANVYLWEQEPEHMLNRGYILIRSSKTERAAR